MEITGRVLVVHEAEGMRALLADLLGREGLTVETVATTFQCIARFVDAPAALVVLGIGGVTETELDLVATLKRETPPPRVVVTFPGPKRDLAVRALEAGADAYLLEPFYTAELLGIVRGQGGPAVPPTAPLVHFAREVAHAINNPLQVITLLLGKDRVTKKELTESIPTHVDRIQEVVGYLRELGVAPETPEPIRGDPAPILERVAIEAGVTLRQEGEIPQANFDERMLQAAVRALFRALRPPTARVAANTITVPGTDAALLDAVFVSSAEREVSPGLALARALFERMGGSLTFADGAFVATY